MNRYGDTPLGMVESALEFARIARDLDYHAIVFSMKSSNPKVMINAYRLLVARLNEEGDDWNYPIHLGVTEAGEGEDARIKSAIGIGSLLARWNWGHDPRFAHRRQRARNPGRPGTDRNRAPRLASRRRLMLARHRCSFDPFVYERRGSKKIERDGVNLGGEELIRIVVRQSNFDKIAHKLDRLGDYQPEIVYEKAGIVEVDPRDEAAVARLNQATTPEFVTVRDDVALPVITAYRLLAARIPPHHSDSAEGCPGKPKGRGRLIFSNASHGGDEHRLASLRRDRRRGSHSGRKRPGQALRLSYNILQAAGSRIFKTDYVACPSCGRTLFNLQTTTARIKEATSHLKGVKIAIMGCIVNGPGEMADADFGYVGGAPGKVNLYVGKTAVKFNIPEADAVDRLQDLIREHGKWVEPAAATLVLA